MSFRIYKYILAFVLAWLFSIGIYEIVNSNKYHIDTIVFDILSQVDSQETPNSETILNPTPISIEDIISKRYLFTLTKEIEKKLSTLVGTGITMGGTYKDYGNVSIIGDSFRFTFESWSIDIPISKYYFDKINQKSRWLVSGENFSASWNKKKMIAITFDDGPSIKYTNILLDILKRENIRATFYVLGRNAEQYPQIIQREYSEWHEIWNHSYSHSLFTKISERMIQEEIYKTDQAIYKAIGVYPKTFRPPYGWTHSGVLEIVWMPAILWSIDPRDWKTHNKKRNIMAVSNAKDGDILIMHDIHEASIASISDIIKSLKTQWFTFVTISELLSLSDEKSEIGKKCTKKWSCK